MPDLPPGAVVLTLDEAIHYFPQWSVEDRLRAREAIDRVGVTEFYTPESASYVAGHGGGTYGRRGDEPVNGLVMHVGYLHLWPNFADWEDDERVELSNYRGAVARSGGSRMHVHQPDICERCFTALPVSGACDFCD